MEDMNMSARERKKLEMLSRIKKDALITQAKASELSVIGIPGGYASAMEKKATGNRFMEIAAERQAAGSRKSPHPQKMTVKVKQSAGSRKP